VVYEESLKGAKYIDLTHTISPAIPVWKGFGPSRFTASEDPQTGKPYTYAKDGFEATSYQLSTDQLGTQLDPPAHWAPEYPAIDELPATYTLRPLVVVSIVDQVARNPGYHLQLADLERWESAHGRIPEGSVVMVRSDWSREWENPELAKREVFPGVSLAALKFLHEQRHILFTVMSRWTQTQRRRSKASTGLCTTAMRRQKELRIWTKLRRRAA